MSAPMQAEVKAAYIYESSVHPHNVLVALNDQRKKGVLCDITVIVQGCEYKAHKAVLASCSSYFNTIITDPANISHNIVLELNCVTKVGIESLLEFAYTAKLSVTKTTIDDIINGVNELEFRNIEVNCLNYLKQQLQGKGMVNLTPCQETPPPYSFNKNDGSIIQHVSSQGQDKVAHSPQGLTKAGDCPQMAKLSLENKPKIEKTGVVTSSCGKESKKFGSCRSKQIRGSQSVIHQPATYQQIPPTNQSQCSSKISMQMQDMGATSPQCMQDYEKQCGMSDYSSLCNSDTDDIGSGDEDNEFSGCPRSGKLRKQPNIELPFTMKQITAMPRSELHDLLTKNTTLTTEQISAIHEIRRRGKNRIAAQRCRKRKMDCVRMLMAEINVLRQEHSALMQQRREARDNACKLSEKFKSTCEKLFKGEKKKKNEVAADTGIDFEEQAQKAYTLAKKLEEWPTEDLPPRPMCPMMQMQGDNDLIVVCEGDYASQPCSPSYDTNEGIVTSSQDSTSKCHLASVDDKSCLLTSTLNPLEKVTASSKSVFTGKPFNIVSRTLQGPPTTSVCYSSPQQMMGLQRGQMHASNPVASCNIPYSPYSSAVDETNSSMDVDTPEVENNYVASDNSSGRNKI